MAQDQQTTFDERVIQINRVAKVVKGGPPLQLHRSRGGG